MSGLSIRAQLAATTVNVGGHPSTIVVKPVTYRVYVEIGSSTIVVIDGDMDATTPCSP